MIQFDGFLPFFGVIEGINDPEQLGRVQVRCYGFHTENKSFIPTDMLRWFSCVVSNSAGVSGIGQSPTGYVKGSTVFGYFLNREMQDGIIIGSITGKPTEQAIRNLGFNDPDGVYPIHIDESDVNRLARNENIDETIVQKKKDSVRTDVETTSGSWSEPETPYNTEYPHNKVSESTSGHIHEVDDTEGSERLHTYHKSGSFWEIHPEGSQVVKIVKDGYTIVSGDNFVCIEGDVSKYIGGNDNLVVKGNQDAAVDGTRTHDVEGKDTLRAPQIQLGEDDAVEPSVLGDQLAKWIETELVPWLNQHQHIGNLGYPTSAPPLAPTGPFEPGEGAKGGGVYSKVNTNQ